MEPSEQSELTLKVTEERLEEVGLELFYNLKTDPTASIDYIAHFMWNEERSEWFPHDEAVKRVVVGRNLGDLKGIVDELNEVVESSIFPKE